MIINFDNNQIQKIREKIFPSFNDITLSKTVITEVGNNVSLELDFSIRDMANKIFNNEKAKNYLKLNIFYVSSNKMENDLKDDNSLDTTLNLLNFYGNPINEFYPANSAIKTEVINSSAILTYKNKIFLRKNINNDFPNAIKLGMFFYYDYSSSEDVKINENKNSKLLLSNVYYLTIEPNNLNVIDKRIYKKLINSETSKAIDDQSLLLNLISQVNTNNVKNLSEVKNTNVIDTLFSNIYVSRNSKDEINFLFNLDDYALILNNINPALYNLFYGSDNKYETLSPYHKIKYVSVLRRKVYKKSKIKSLEDFGYEPAETSYEVLVSGQRNSTNNLISATNAKAAIIQNSISIDEKYKSFTVTDKEILNKNRGFYQYGIEIKVFDSIIEKFLERINSFSSKKNIAEAYYKETEKINSKNVESINGNSKYVDAYYDPATDSFTRKFNDVFFNKYLQGIQELVSETILLLDFFGVLDKFVSINNIPFPQTLTYTTNFFFSMLDPSTASATSILQFLKICNNIETNARKIIKNNKNNSYTVQKWFENEVIDTTTPKKCGYDFFDTINSNQDGIFKILSNNYIDLVSQEVVRYSGNRNLDANISNKQFNYLSPTRIKFNNQIYQLNNLENNDFYSNLELQIKNYIFNSIDNSDTSIDNALVAVKQNKLSAQQEAALQAFSKISGLLGIEIDNSLENLPSDLEAFDSRITLKENKNINTKLLFLMLSRAKKLEIKKNLQLSGDYPYHLDLLYTNNNLNIFNGEEQYLKNISLLSKYFFFYNTIHKVEFLKYNNNVKDEIWQPLTIETIKSINKGNFILCKLTRYENKNFNVGFFNEIELPVYNKYFLLEGNSALINSLTTEIPQNIVIINQVQAVGLNRFSSFANIINTSNDYVLGDVCDITTNFAPSIYSQQENLGILITDWIGSGFFNDGNYPLNVEIIKQAWLKSQAVDYWKWKTCELLNQRKLIMKKSSTLITNNNYILETLKNNSLDSGATADVTANTAIQQFNFKLPNFSNQIAFTQSEAEALKVLPELFLPNFLIKKYGLNFPLIENGIGLGT